MPWIIISSRGKLELSSGLISKYLQPIARYIYYYFPEMFVFVIHNLNHNHNLDVILFSRYFLAFTVANVDLILSYLLCSMLGTCQIFHLHMI